MARISHTDLLSLPVPDMQLLVCVQKLNILVVTSQQTVTQIKAQVASPEGIVPVDKVVLLVDTPLEDDAVLTQCVVQALSTLEVAGCMLGWGLGVKVHGSLACAEKVRGQTRKVAKRPLQYNRRFVNVMPTFGKKKGPNANS
ncbi:ubiquitin-like protein FUBI [Ochotona curzoniae]|uniref:ubiquitin-like protein FUBI n=1 Tax=Ochotona curzoniae TaxID=130825 RepID=UPI001B345B69|nr:ubiquitin-like protein FUBI [Ochotona curzoniae]